MNKYYSNFFEIELKDIFKNCPNTLYQFAMNFRYYTYIILGLKST